ncbi:hypothetical protein BDV24DRAFT_166719 [Aspergillus arachidicola]|uniref:Uncharacterized protein n=1 Tax=Aspergillus arachidicola TaxID=656916 RepID=A0A5N6XYI9_9EURO|nr:hypothetical protein BDV24DRAFT_166719 [Aspergillus arachidicola]
MTVLCKENLCRPSGSEGCQGQKEHEHGLPLLDVARRVHAGRPGQERAIPLEVLWTRKSIEDSPFGNYISEVKEELYGIRQPISRREGWTYTPSRGIDEALSLTSDAGPFSSWSHGIVDMTENALSLLYEIMRLRAKLPDPSARHTARVRLQQLIVGDDPVGAILRRAREGANNGRSTKSKVAPCTSPAYTQVMDEFGLGRIVAYPVILGTWWMSMLMQDFDDWRQDYVATLGYSFYFEYNLDTAAIGGESPSQLLKELTAIWDMPDLPEELRVRRSHMLCSMAFFELKRKHEATVRDHTTDGYTAWVHTERDMWRDFKALDSGGFGHYLSYATGLPGRDDMMLAGLVNDWVDLGPDLRYQECNQSVFALTRGSVVLTDLLDCYERTVWMLNASFTSNERHVAFAAIAGACIWQMTNHRQDVWRYYSLAFDLCSTVQVRELYKIAELAECYTPNLMPRALPDAEVLHIPRRSHFYHVDINGTEHTGTVMLHTTLCDAIESGIFPESMINFQIIVPLLLRRGEIDPGTFLSHMDSHYCTHLADVMRSGHANNFSYQYARAVAALVMEEWWSGMFLAIGIGSLIEAQPGHVADDRQY